MKWNSRNNRERYKRECEREWERQKGKKEGGKEILKRKCNMLSLCLSSFFISLNFSLLHITSLAHSRLLLIMKNYCLSTSHLFVFHCSNFSTKSWSFEAKIEWTASMTSIPVKMSIGIYTCSSLKWKTRWVRVLVWEDNFCTLVHYEFQLFFALRQKGIQLCANVLSFAISNARYFYLNIINIDGLSIIHCHTKKITFCSTK